MRRWSQYAFTLLPAFLVLLLAGEASAQQTGTIAGRVLKAGTQEPVVGAQVMVAGTQLGQVTAANGRFVILNVPVGQRTVQVQSMGWAFDDRTVTVVAGQSAAVDIEGREQAITIAPVVATALGIQRAERSLGFAVQSVSSDLLERSPERTLVSALAGQSAGVQIASSSGRPGANARMTIRGESSFTGSGQPLFVIDGVPVSMDIDGPSNALGSGSAGSRSMDLDMENVSEISVLRGAAATALYGSRAAAGAVIITTKQGRPGQSLRFEVSSEYAQDRPIIEGYTTNYTAGSRGYFCNGKDRGQGGWCMPGFPAADPNPLQTGNWGPHKDSIPQMVFDSSGPVRMRDVREDFYRTAQTMNHSIRASGGLGDLGTFTFGVSYLDQGDIFPLAELRRLNLNTNVNVRLSSYLNSNLSIQRINTRNAFNEDSWNGFTRTLINIPPNWDVRQGWNTDGSPVMWGTNNPHPDWRAINEYRATETNRWIVSQQFVVNIMQGVTLSNRWGLDTYLTEGRQFNNERPWRTLEALPSGGTQHRKEDRKTINNDLVLSLSGMQLGGGGFTVSGLVGGNVYMTEHGWLRADGSNVTIPGFQNIANFQDQRVFAQIPTRRRLLGAYSQATIDYNDWAFLTFTGRNDWSSTLPTASNSYFYPSVSLGLVFTDALGWHPDWLQYGKLRLSTAKVGADAPPYRLSSRYASAVALGAANGIQQFSGPRIQFPFRGQNAYFQHTQLGNPELRPESTVEHEAGLELRLLNGRARADISVYDKRSYDQIFDVPSSAVTGYTQIARNAGDLRNRGVELSLQARPIQTRNLSWNVRANWSKNDSKVLELAPGVPSISLAGYSWPQIRIMQGQPYGVIWGYGFKRNCVEVTAERPLGRDGACFANVAPGTLLTGDNGHFIRTDQQLALGDVLHDWLANFSTDVSYRSVRLSGLVDIKRGGQLLNFETQYQVTNGRSKITESRGTPIVHEGVNLNTGQPNTVELMRDQDYYGLVYGFDRHENQIEPAGFIKLREATLSVALPRTLTQRMDVQSMSLYITGRNLGVWTDFSMGDPEGDVYGGANAGGAYFRQFPQPQTRAWVVGVRAAF